MRNRGSSAQREMKKAAAKKVEEEEDSGSDIDVDEGFEDDEEENEATQNDLKRGIVVSKVRLAPPLRFVLCSTSAWFSL